jgi:pimeloyl-[acyl-carrier protein] methyl ester esterase
LQKCDLRSTTAQISCPTLVVHGGRDALAPIAAGRWLAENISRARLLELPDAAHLPFFSHQDMFTEAVESFLA